MYSSKRGASSTTVDTTRRKHLSSVLVSLHLCSYANPGVGAVGQDPKVYSTSISRPHLCREIAAFHQITSKVPQI